MFIDYLYKLARSGEISKRATITNIAADDAAADIRDLGNVVFNWQLLVKEVMRLDRPQVFAIQNVYDLVGDQTCAWNDSMFGIVSPPYPSCWFEFTYRDGANTAWLTGVLVTHFECTSRIIEKLLGSDPARKNEELTKHLKNTASIIRTAEYSQSVLNENRISATQFNTLTLLDAKGMALLTFMSGGSPEEMKHVTYIHFIVLYALSLINCKNIVQTEKRQDRATRRRHEREFGVGPVTYKVLEIGPGTAAPQHSKAQTAEEHAKAMHLCRGHWAHYGPEFGTGLLFGRVSGQFWIPQHVKGNAAKGIVVKDYKVKGKG